MRLAVATNPRRTMATISGGQKLEKALRDLARALNKAGSVRVGFLQKATYPDGKPVAMIAAIQEYGAPRAHIPPRPYFRNMIAKESPQWPARIAVTIKATGYDTAQMLDLLGEAIAGQLRQSIRDLWSPPLSPKTVARKGFDKPLIFTSHMLNSVGWEVKVT